MLKRKEKSIKYNVLFIFYINMLNKQKRENTFIFSCKDLLEAKYLDMAFPLL